METSALKRRLQLFAHALFLFVSIAWGTGCSESGTTFPQTARKTTQFINQTMAENNMVGLSIALVSGQQIVWAEGFGWADKENKVPATADTAYMLGSGSKTLTTVALLQLMDRGLVALDRPATDYLPEFQLAARYPNQMREITVERLLNHHSGIPGDIYNGGFVEQAWNQWGCDLYTDWLLSILPNEYPSYAPGEISVYCNTGFVLAGEIALRQGRIGAETFNEFMIRQLFRPLEMHNTRFRATSGEMAVGYIGGAAVPPAEANCTFAATGGAVTTVLDMGSFLAMILNRGIGPGGGRILDPETVSLMGQSEKTPLDLNAYSTPGLGLDTVDDPVLRYAGRAWAKNGSTGHFNSFLELLPDKKLAAIVLTNSDTAKWPVFAIVRECLKNAVQEKTGARPSLPPYPDLPSVADPAVIAGTYVKSSGFDRVTDNLDGTLSLAQDAHKSGSPPVVKLMVYEKDSWTVRGASERIVFRNISFMGADHFAMIQIGSSGSVVEESVFGGHVVLVQGEKTLIPAIGPAWQSRTGLPWVVENIAFNDLNWERPFLLVENVGGVPMIRQGGNLQVILPADDNLAFVGGLSNRNGSAVRVATVGNRQKLFFVGYEAYPMDRVPVVFSGSVINANLDFHKTDWYRFDSAAPGTSIVFEVPTGAGGYRLRLFNGELKVAVAENTDRLSYTAPPGSFYLALSRTPDAPASYTLLVNP